MIRTLCLLAALATGLGATPARADEPIATYALVVGSNQGGPGQTDLRYAEDDARRVARLLVELGGYTPAQVDIMVGPTPDELRARLGQLGQRVAADAAAGRPSRLLFYYSGHARATAIDLGRQQMPLAELRQRLFDMPAKLTVVVLDACQSGAFSRVKGAEPAADFSFNSRRQLDASGIAVLASSSSSELSQESEQLRSSYFTHHLLVGLRGAGDANRDGLVTIDEAYRYAYHQTLLATAETAVGGQHVSLEVDLKGHGEVPLSFPRAATTTIELPAALEGRTLVEDKRARAVIAETYKAKGAAVRIAVAPGDYQVLVRRGDQLSRCDVSGGGVVDLGRCRTETVVVAKTKGSDTFARPTRIGLTLGAGAERRDGFTDNLEAFGYREQGLLPVTRSLELTGMRRLSRHVWVGGALGYHALPDWRHAVTGSDAEQRWTWSTTTARALARAEQPLGDAGVLSRIAVFAQLAGGLGIGRSELKNAEFQPHRDTHLGWAFGVAGGLHAESPAFAGLGLTAGYAFDYAPVISDLIGNTHATGGHRATFALTYSF
jgi:hypothetical protein